MNNVVYIPYASHGDNGPYHGWVLGFSASNLALTAVFNDSPNGTAGGIWEAGGSIAFDGTYFYFESGNGTFDGNNGTSSATNPTSPAPGPVTGLNAAGFPAQGDYGDSFVKLAIDPTTSATNENINGWGLTVVDYFTPYNQLYLTAHDLDLGSGAPLILPASAGSTAIPNLIVGGGKTGTLYLVNRDNMGKFGLTDNIVQEVGGALSSSLDTAAYYNNTIYYVEGYGGNAKTFSISNAVMSSSPTTRSNDTFTFAGSTPVITVDGSGQGVVWDVDRGSSQLRAYSTNGYNLELYTSAQAPGNRDSLGQAVKFEVPTVANGHVYVASGTGNPNNFLVIYGLINSPTSPPLPPSNLTATAASSSQINLYWTDNDVQPNLADYYAIEDSTDGVNFSQIATVAVGASAYYVGNLQPDSTYYFRVRAHDAVGFSSYTNIASTTTLPAGGAQNLINFPNGFDSRRKVRLRSTAARRSAAAP